jgi:predicted ester cyclase
MIRLFFNDWRIRMSLTPEQMSKKIDEHFAFEANDDVEGVLATLAEDAVHDVIGWPPGPSQGRESARAFYKRMFEDLSESEVTTTRRLHGDSFIVDESVWQGKAPGAPFGLQGRGRPLKFRLLHVMEFTEAGEIQREQVWLDLAAIIQQLPED